MSKEWIDVVDTAVKIGLGSLITGFFTYIGVKLSKSSEIQKHFVEHKTKVFESSMSEVHEYFSAFKGFVSLLGGMATDIGNLDAIDFPNNRKKSMLKSDSILVEAWKTQDSAIASLNILGAHDCAKALSKAKKIEKEIRDIVVFEEKLPTFETIKDTGKRFREVMDEFYKESSKYYDSLYK